MELDRNNATEGGDPASSIFDRSSTPVNESTPLSLRRVGHCKEIKDFLSDYLNDKLPWRQRLSFNIHLLLWPHCRQHLASYATIARVSRSLGQEADSESDQIPAELARSFRQKVAAA